jgi:diacylglycerol kinase
MVREKFSLKKRLKSFGYAFNGLRVMFKEEHNSRIHLFFTGIVVLFMLLFRFTLIEYGMLAFAIGLVFAAELFNSAIENIADHISPERNENIKKVKDLSAAAVLVCAVTAFAIGCLVLGPKFILLIKLL